MREPRVAEHDRDDRMLAGPDPKPASVIARAEPARVGREPVAARSVAPTSSSKAGERGRDERRRAACSRRGTGRERWRRSATISRRARGEAAARAAERLAERRGDDVDAPGDAAVLGRAPAGRAEEAGGVAVVDHRRARRAARPDRRSRRAARRRRPWRRRRRSRSAASARPRVSARMRSRSARSACS